MDIKAWITLGLPQSQTIASIDDVLDFSEYENLPEKPAATPEKPLKTEKKEQSASSSHHPAILYLDDLLHQCPVVIHPNPAAFGLRKQVNFDPDKHWGLFGKISAMIFNDDVISAYLAKHPAKAINASNFLIDEEEAATAA